MDTVVAPIPMIKMFVTAGIIQIRPEELEAAAPILLAPATSNSSAGATQTHEAESEGGCVPEVEM